MWIIRTFRGNFHPRRIPARKHPTLLQGRCLPGLMVEMAHSPEIRIRGKTAPLFLYTQRRTWGLLIWGVGYSTCPHFSALQYRSWGT